MVSKLGFAAATAAVGFVGYCVYFDHKRRNHPDYRRKINERRKAAAEASRQQTAANFPDPRDPTAVQRFFLEEIQTGEALINIGDVENGITHLANAVTVCAQPNQLLSVLQQSISPQIFTLLMQALPETKKKFNSLKQDDDDLE